MTFKTFLGAAADEVANLQSRVAAMASQFPSNEMYWASLSLADAFAQLNSLRLSQTTHPADDAARVDDKDRQLHLDCGSSTAEDTPSVHRRLHFDCGSSTAENTPSVPTEEKWPYLDCCNLVAVDSASNKFNNSPLWIHKATYEALSGTRESCVGPEGDVVSGSLSLSINTDPDAGENSSGNAATFIGPYHPCCMSAPRRSRRKQLLPWLSAKLEMADLAVRVEYGERALRPTRATAVYIDKLMAALDQGEAK
ncbi:hypothetical protein M406DRAFT_74121 [Cryphonectria parasitica EP155]|uniref:Uncharacterized protein n=1 Tax=Cryphonectria parasitica (strain ATCC 38755 / EP155) TaxID=660469 RepID=A0A9P4XZ19_CRYP1|nr:uncharacterized protein M406DRAFT_74121 [Cryphonectria parasitica EP155]KAF3763526.1 hypothetical protein M406DRAFT_74121 [Cryphonectria parasitica EP155]